MSCEHDWQPTQGLYGRWQIENYTRGLRLEVDADRANIEFLYPRIDGHISELEIGLEDVRAADSIRICYDFDRDGWSILQSSETDNWKEVAFILAWGSETP